MNIESYSLTWRKPIYRWYKGYCGLTIFGIKLLGFSITNEKVMVQLKPEIRSKPSVGVWLYLVFWEIYIQIKDPWKDENNK